MIREDLVTQRTCDSFFNATVTLNHWNANNPTQKKEMNEYRRTKTTSEFIDYLIKHEGIEKPYSSSNKGTWMHPLLYIDFCMWISLEFKTMALKFVLDGLINTRNSAGDYYKEMCAVIMEKYVDHYNTKPSPMMYIKEANMINNISGINKNRNEMTESELQKITMMQKVNANLISKNVGVESRKNHLKIIAESI